MKFAQYGLLVKFERHPAERVPDRLGQRIDRRRLESQVRAPNEDGPGCNGKPTRAAERAGAVH